jgi:hypothetical protein
MRKQGKRRKLFLLSSYSRTGRNKENGENDYSSLHMGPAVIEKMDRACSIFEEN